jgi:hypothetical protein
MATAYDPYLLLIAAIVITVIVIAVMYVIIRTLRRRAAKLRLDLDTSPRVRDDRAFNQIRLARAEAAILLRSGVDVDRPLDLLAQADRRMELRDSEGALELARSAHESLVRLQQSGPSRLPAAAGTATAASAVATPPPPNGTGSASRGPILAGGAATAAAAPEPNRLVKNRAESHFQLTLLVEDLDRIRAIHPKDPILKAGDAGLLQAQSAYAAGEYTEALKLALKTRRTVGGQLETLPPPKRAPGAVERSEDEDAESLSRGETEGQKAVGARPCPQCGRPVAQGDRFCRLCGASTAPGTCPRCGASLGAADIYCGSCGAPTS